MKTSAMWYQLRPATFGLTNMVIPKTVKNQDAAYAFINFMLKPENALKNAEYVGYSNTKPTS